MDSEFIHNLLSSEFPKLPQKEHVPMGRARLFLEKIVKTNPKANLKWLLDRMGGIGGSESAAILNHYFKSATHADVDTTVEFKDAHDVSLEKLMLGVPLQIPQADRGNRIEGMISDIFVTRYSLQGFRDDAAMEAAKRHATNQFMIGNADEVFNKGKRILVDYKSANSHQDKVKYSHTVQVNHYQENMRSNQMPADLSVVATLSAPEDVLLEFVKIYEARNENPDDYWFFVNAIAKEKFSFAKLTVTPVQTSPEFGKLISDSVTRFMNEYPLAGKVVSQENIETVLVGEKLKEAEEISNNIFQIISAEQAITQIKQALLIKAKELAESIDGNFDWPCKDLPINAAPAYTNNFKAGIEALELSGFETDKIYKKTDEVDNELLLEKFKSLGGIVDNSICKKSIDKEKYQNALIQIGLTDDLFKNRDGIKFNYSRKVSAQDQIYSSQINLQSKIVDVITEAIYEEEQSNLQNSFS